MTVTATRQLPMVTATGKRWVRVTFHRPPHWIPSFRDIHRIVQAICLCEDEKYPNGQGRRMVRDFLSDCTSEARWTEIEAKYKIPVRCGAERNPLRRR